VERAAIIRRNPERRRAGGIEVPSSGVFAESLPFKAIYSPALYEAAVVGLDVRTSWRYLFL
jgi:hypothetical protein